MPTFIDQHGNKERYPVVQAGYTPYELERAVVAALIAADGRWLDFNALHDSIDWGRGMRPADSRAKLRDALGRLIRSGEVQRTKQGAAAYRAADADIIDLFRGQEVQ